MATAIEISEKAAARIRALLAEKGTPAGGLRLGVKGGGCSGLSYHVDWAAEPARFDQVVEREGARVFVDPKSAMFLAGTVVDRDGAPVPGAAVFATPDGEVGPEVPAAYARAGGAFFVPGPFSSERLRLWASHPEHGPSDPVRVRLGEGPVTLVVVETGDMILAVEEATLLL